MSAPLEDITVVEIDNWMAAPSAGALLADMGAQVIKIEPLGGDPMRGTGRPPKHDDAEVRDYDFSFDVDNRGKRSISIDLTSETGQQVVARLVERADVFMCNLLPVRQKKFGVDAQTLFARNGRLVHATLTGYGTDGPDAWRPGFDVTAFFGRSGMFDAIREGNDGIPPQARPAQGDHTTGLALLAAILAALRQVDRTGTPQAVETSLFETAIWTQATDFSTTAVDQAPVRRRARHQLITPTGNRYPCGCGRWLAINMPTAHGYDHFAKVLGHPEWLDDPRFATPRDRFANMAECVALIDEAMATKSRDEWGEIFDAQGIIWGPLQSLDETSRDPQAHAIGMFPEMEHPEVGRYRTVRGPMRFHNADVGPKAPAPECGADSRDLLAETGYSDAEIDALLASGSVVQGDGTA